MLFLALSVGRTLNGSLELGDGLGVTWLFISLLTVKFLIVGLLSVEYL